MRVVLVACVLLAAQSAAAEPALAVPWIEAGPEDDEDVEHLAAELSVDHLAIADDHAMHGQHGLAAAKYEVALHCRYDSRVVAKLFLSACNARDAVTARRYYPLLPPVHAHLRQRCIAYGIQLP